MIKEVLVLAVCAAVALTVGILIGHFGISKSSSSSPAWTRDVLQDVDENLIRDFMSEVDNMKIKDNLQ